MAHIGNVRSFINEKCKNSGIDRIILESGAISKLPEAVSDYNAKKVFVFGDKTTYEVAGRQVLGVLKDADIMHSFYFFDKERLTPDEVTVGGLAMHFDLSCDLIIAVGSGVINDTGKILASIAGVPYIIVATAPSMDGYASDTSAMEVGGLKTSVKAKCAEVIIGDIDVLKEAPVNMLRAGLGDMLAKYSSICEWRISNIVTNEFYSEDIAAIVRAGVKRCVDHADGLMRREPEAVEAVFEGLILTGIAMNEAGITRPASGIEHSISHIWDMRALEFGTNCDLHGTQCAIGTLISSRIASALKSITPDRERALQYVEAFDRDAWFSELETFIGRAALQMKKLDDKERKYEPDGHAKRLEIILNRWNEILSIIEEELPSPEFFEELYDRVGMPKSPSDIGIDQSIMPVVIKATKDIRFKYLLGQLAFDIGELDAVIDRI